MLAARLPILHKAALAACDRLDGLETGLVSDRLACRFDAGSIEGVAGRQETASCLTGPKMAFVRKLYDGLREPQPNERLTGAGPIPGSEPA
ncbi:tannase/feruloyl esterase family alpha/beta hydrolase [Methylobacterium fujisawaense]|uniref:tannase/feruloyl esterase family alpha/beta hydrolase n=1 Tax=Methylobacterium fujisawaense TaxID=107400 RepID=UPI00313DD6DB